MNAPLYTLEILRLAASLPEPAELDRVDATGEARSPTCGSVVRTQVCLGEDRRVAALSQQVQACAFGQASAALLAAHTCGRSRAEVELAMSTLASWLSGGDDLPDWPGFAALAPAQARTSRHGAILLPFRALLAAFDSTQ